MSNVSFRFTPETHEYLDLVTGALYPHITELLERAGLVNAEWYTEQSKERGNLIHSLAMQYDLGAIDREYVSRLESPWDGWLRAHIAAMDVVRPCWQSIEEPRVHAQLRFAGRPDRVGTVYGATSVLEIKSGACEDAHAIQLAFQAILIESDVAIPAEAIQRYGLYLKRTGRWRLQSFPNTRQDFQKAREILRRFT